MTALATSKQPWAIRPALPEDISFIYSTWLNSFRVDSALGNSVSKTVYFGSYHSIVDRLLDESRVLVACLSDDPKVILGYLVSQSANVLHYCFVKEAFRRHGIASALFDEAFHGAGAVSVSVSVQHTHETNAGVRAIKFDRRKDSRELSYNPFLLFQKI